MKQLIIVIMLLASANVSAQSFVTGHSLSENCNATESSSAFNLQIAECRGYIAGVNDAMLKEGIFCTPIKATLGQLRPVVTRWLNEHPESLHFPASSLVQIALAKAFPCPEKK